MTSKPPPHYYHATVPSQDVQADAPASQALLLSLEQGGANWLSSCRNGSCRTCIGKLASGSVRYAIEWPGLSSEELAEGYVLPCVAYPCSDVVLDEE
ncbi:MAG: 2Fe-2S iron-sulfur cluster binding domain-containing protein [Rhodoferax sp.]|nr:2Fe-2S iron-sulfur cluster binding domain-containing protein [Rhodoferax sp.]